MRKRKPTIGDVAQAAGVSLATVDRVLNARGGVDPGKELRVLAAARHLRMDRDLRGLPSRTMRIAVLIQAPVNPFHAALRHGFALAGRLHAELNLQFLIQHIDPNRAADIATAIGRLDKRIDGLILSVPEEAVIVEAVRAFACSRPVVTLATDLPKDVRAAYVGPDDHRAGRVAGDLMGLFLGREGGRVLLIAGRRNIAGQAAREAGFCQILAERHPSLALADVVTSGEEGDRAGRIVHERLAADPGIRGIYHMSVGAQPVADVLYRLGCAGTVAFITHELTPDRRMLLRERVIAAVIDQQPELEACLAVETMSRLLGRLEGTPETTLTDFRIYLSENA